MRRLIVATLIGFVSLSCVGCFNIEKVKKELQERSAQLDGATKRSNDIAKRLVDNPASVSADEKTELLSYLSDTRKVVTGLNVLVGNYSFMTAMRILFVEGVVSVEDVWGLYQGGKITIGEYEIIVKKK